MKNYARKLVSDFLRQEEAQERLDVFAAAMLLGPEAKEAFLASAKPVAVAGDSGWIAALWLSTADEDPTGEMHVVAENCRSQKLALITANYYRLHHLINADINPNSANTSSSC